jgi:Tfp pilus assembly protein FimV
MADLTDLRGALAQLKTSVDNAVQQLQAASGGVSQSDIDALTSQVEAMQAELTTTAAPAPAASAPAPAAAAEASAGSGGAAPWQAVSSS